MAKFRQSTLARLQEQVLDELEQTPNTGKYKFFTEEDSQRTLNRDLVKAEITTVEQVKLALSSINYVGTGKPLVGIDLETTRLEHWMPDSEILCVGFTIPQYNFTSKVSYKFYCVFGDFENLAEIIEYFNPYVRWCLHNGKFDMLWLLNHLGVMLKHVEDSMVLAYLLTNGKGTPINIEYLANTLLNRYPYTLEDLTGVKKKSITPERMKGIDKQELADYCCEDTYEGVLLYQHFMNELSTSENANLLGVYEEIDKHCAHHLVWMEDVGIRVDLSSLGEILEDVTIEQECIKDECRAYAYHVNVDSPQELSVYLYDELKLPTKGIKKGKKGFFSTDQTSLSANKGNHPIIDLLLENRKLGKLSSSFLKPLPVLQRSGRIHCTFNNCRTATGRYSCDYPNMQQIPNPAKSAIGKKIRKLYVASEGYAIIRADYSQMELRVLAEISQDKFLLEAYRSNKDVHVLVTEMLLGIVYDAENPEHKRWRTLVKNINFGIIYGMTKHRLHGMCVRDNIPKTLDECQEIIDNYLSLLVGVRDWMFGIAYCGAIERGYTETLHGRRRYFDFEHPYLKALRGTGMDYTYQNYKMLEKKGVLSNPKDMESLRSAGNAPIQGGNADACRIAASKIYDEFNYYNNNYNDYYNNSGDVRLLLLVHDEVVAEAKIEIAMQARDRIVQIMEEAYPMSIPTKVSSSISDSWGSAD